MGGGRRLAKINCIIVLNVNDQYLQGKDQGAINYPFND